MIKTKTRNSTQLVLQDARWSTKLIGLTFFIWAFFYFILGFDNPILKEGYGYLLPVGFIILAYITFDENNHLDFDATRGTLIHKTCNLWWCRKREFILFNIDRADLEAEYDSDVSRDLFRPILKFRDGTEFHRLQYKLEEEIRARDAVNDINNWLESLERVAGIEPAP